MITTEYCTSSDARVRAETARPRGTDSAKVISVICTESLMGRGIEGDALRMVTQYWSLDGELLAVNDPEDNS